MPVPVFKLLGGGAQAAPLVNTDQWSYEIHGIKIAFGQEANEKIQEAYSKDEPTVQVFLRGDVFVIDLMAKTGCGQETGEHITLSRDWMVSSTDQAGIPLPENWAPMPHPNTTVHTVQLSPGSSEYQVVMSKLQATASNLNVQKIERVQNPYLYQAYMLRKQKMERDNGADSERQLFHGTRAENTSSINAQGFNRSFCRNDRAIGSGVYFARDACYSARYLEYLARRGGGSGAVRGGSGAVRGGRGAVYRGSGAVPGGSGAVLGGSGAVRGGRGAVPGGSGAVQGGSGAVHGGSGGGDRFMYLARVLVGQYCIGNPSMIVPPPKDPSRPDVLYDSVVEQLGNPSIFVVFFDNQCYPEYLITFQ